MNVEAKTPPHMRAKKPSPARFVPSLVVVGLYGLLRAVNPGAFAAAYDTAVYGTREMLMIIPPVFVLLGLLDVWVPREVLTLHMGERSGVRGAAMAFLIGSAAAGPLYVAFPIAGMLMKKGASFFNVLVFIGAWSTTKIPMFLFELQSLGARFAVTRAAVNVVGILLMAALIGSRVKGQERADIYARAASVS